MEIERNIGTKINTNNKISDRIHFGVAYERKFAKMLDEGMLKSFPTETVKKDIRTFLSKMGMKTTDSSYGEVDFVVRDEGEMGEGDEFNDMDIIRVEIDEKYDLTEIRPLISKRLERDGWYICDELKGPDSNILACEPSYPIENDRIEQFSRDQIAKYKIFYHNTMQKYVKNIFRNGLVPTMGSREDFKHPDRIYLFGSLAMAGGFSGIAESRIMIPESEREEIHKMKKYADPNELERVILVVDLESCLADGKLIKLYHDNRWDRSSPAFFTVNTILPKYIMIL